MNIAPESLPTLHCEVCKNSNPDNFRFLYRFPDCEVVECAACRFTFVPQYWRTQTSYENYKSAAVAEHIRKGNNWIKIQRHKLRIQLIKKYKKTGKLLDIGSGWGHFLLTAGQCGYQIKGVELDNEPYKYSTEDLKLPVEKRNFFEFPDGDKYDIITLWDVLEHIDAADPFIEKCSKITADNGIIVIQVPQIDSSIAKKKKNTWNMMGLDHVNYFSPKTIAMLLNRHGYHVETVKSSIELKLFLMYTILPYLKRKKKAGATVNNAEQQAYYNKVTQRPMWQLRLFILLHNIVYKTLSLLHVGEEMIVVARKKAA